MAAPCVWDFSICCWLEQVPCHSYDRRHYSLLPILDRYGRKSLWEGAGTLEKIWLSHFKGNKEACVVKQCDWRGVSKVDPRYVETDQSVFSGMRLDCSTGTFRKASPRLVCCGQMLKQAPLKIIYSKELFSSNSLFTPSKKIGYRNQWRQQSYIISYYVSDHMESICGKLWERWNFNAVSSLFCLFL